MPKSHKKRRAETAAQDLSAVETAARAASTPAGRMLGQAVQKTMAKPGAKAPPAPRRGADYRTPPSVRRPLYLLLDLAG